MKISYIDRLTAPHLVPFVIVSNFYSIRSFVIQSLEGGQGALLHPIYDQPFSTSSPIWPPIGLGDPLNVVVGVAKACFQTRVGDGPFPGELFGPTADAIRQLTGEYGATTGRDRRLREPNTVAMREGIRRVGANFVILTKIDVGCDINDKIIGLHAPICRWGWDGMTWDGKPISWWKSNLQVHDQSRPDQTSSRLKLTNQFALPWLTGNIASVTSAAELDPSAKEFVTAIKQHLQGVPVPLLKTGPSAEDMVVL